MAWYLLTKNGLWKMDGAKATELIRRFPSSEPISTNNLAPDNLVVDLLRADPEVEAVPSPVPSPAPGLITRRTPKADALVIKWEGYHRALTDGSAAAYPDSALAWDVPTIGFGTTRYQAAGLKRFGRSAVKQGDVIPRDVAESELEAELDKIEAALARAIRVPVTQSIFDAMCSFAYNVGLDGAQMQIDRINAGNFEECAAKFDLYVNANGRPLQGLINRRNDEEALFRAEPFPSFGSPSVGSPSSCQFRMALKKSPSLIVGSLDFMDANSKVLRTFPATSGLAGYQSIGDVWTRGAGPIPSVQGQQILFSDGYYLATTGIEGWAFPMRPDPILRDGKVGRSEIMLHRDANTPGTAGCIGLRLSASDYDEFVKWAKNLGTLPLKVIYT